MEKIKKKRKKLSKVTCSVLGGENVEDGGREEPEGSPEGEGPGNGRVKAW